jgi:hypothetical protein
MEDAARRLVDRQIRDILAGMLEGEADRSEECLRMGREAGLEHVPGLVEEILILVRERELHEWDGDAASTTWASGVGRGTTGSGCVAETAATELRGAAAL